MIEKEKDRYKEKQKVDRYINCVIIQPEDVEFYHMDKKSEFGQKCIIFNLSSSIGNVYTPSQR